MKSFSSLHFRLFLYLKRHVNTHLIMYCCYILESECHSYVGCTNNTTRRLRQHNGDIVGGARANRGKTSWFAAIISGFPDQRSALQFEWAIKHAPRAARHVRGARARIAHTCAMLIANRACKRCSTGCQHTWDWTQLEMRVISKHADAVDTSDLRMRIVDIL